MEPRFHTGDLAILRAAPEYRVGDVAGYRSATLGAVVMHRIVADDGGVFTFKGDNNSWTDPDHPTQADLIGRLAVRVPHGGRYLGALDSTPGRGVAGGVLALLLLGGAGRARRRRALRTSGRHRAGGRTAPARKRAAGQRGAGQRAPGQREAAQRVAANPRPRTARAVRWAELAAAAVALLALAGAEAWLLNQSPTVPSSRTLVVKQTGTFGYGADVASSVVYPDGKVRAGQPIFTELARTVDFSFDYRADAPLSGTVALSAALVGPSGWTSPLATGTAARVRDGAGQANVRVDLAGAQAALDAFTAATGVKATSASVVLTPRLDATGAVDGQPVTAAFGGKLTLAAGANQLIVVSTPNPDGASATAADPLVVSAPVDVKAPATAARTLHVLSWRVSVANARVAAGVGALGALGWLIVVLLASRRTGVTDDDVEAALRRYGDRIVDAEPMSLDGPVVDLTSLAALHSIAERYDRVILHTTRGARHSYLVRDELSWYRYDVRPDRPQHAARRDNGRPDFRDASWDGRDVVVLDDPAVIQLEPRLEPRLEPQLRSVDILPGMPDAGFAMPAWADSYAQAS